MIDKTYYKTSCGKLIQYNKVTDTFSIRNEIKKVDKRISINEFLLLNSTIIKSQEFSRLMNIFYNSIKESWIFEGTEYQSLDNFERKDYNLSANYNIGKEVPFHEIPSKYNPEYKKNMILVYHWGKVYYHDISYNGEVTGSLYDTQTLNSVQWCKLKNCAPIFNKSTKKIM